MTKITIRRFDRNVVQALTNRGFPEPLARALAARHVTSPSDLDYEFKEMLSPWDLKNCREAGEAIADAIWKQKKIVIIGDYDCDGATAVSVGILGLQALGAFNVSYLIPDRDKDGYGLGLYIVKTILEQHKEKISVTSEDGVTAFSFSLATE